jgi:membrane-associated phospholipid phosphatase
MENNLTYTKNGDYLIPDLTITEQTESIGKYGRMRKDYLKEHRPVLYNSLLLSEKLYPHVPDSSFPSNHATVTMSTAAGLLRVNRILGWVCVALSPLVGFSKIYVGHHYPLDVLSSFLIVFLTNVAFHRFFEGRFTSLYLRADSKIFHCRAKSDS